MKGVNSKVKPFKTFIIRHKVTKEVWKASSGKTSWKQQGHAKNAWANTYSSPSSYPEEYKHLAEGRKRWDTLYFDEQDDWEIVELKDVITCGECSCGGLSPEKVGKLKKLAEGYRDDELYGKEIDTHYAYEALMEAFFGEEFWGGEGGV